MQLLFFVTLILRADMSPAGRAVPLRAIALATAYARYGAHGVPAPPAFMSAQHYTFCILHFSGTRALFREGAVQPPTCALASAASGVLK